METRSFFDSAERSAPKPPVRILVADDDLHVRNVLVMILTQHGYWVATANDGIQASAVVDSERDAFDLVITDHEMPRLDGLGLVQHLRSANYRGKILVHSSPPGSAERRAYEELSVDGILSKPCLYDLFVRTIQEITG